MCKIRRSSTLHKDFYLDLINAQSQRSRSPMTGSTQLIQFEFIRVSGPDARTFLQGQVTCDTTKITPTQSVLGALCNLKGRVIADFRAAQWGEDILLRVGAGLAVTFYKTSFDLVAHKERLCSAYGDRTNECRDALELARSYFFSRNDDPDCSAARHYSGPHNGQATR